MHIVVSARKVLIVLLVIIFLLVTANVLGIYSKYWLGYDHVFGLVKFFDLNTENNAPSFYSALAIIFCAVLLAVIALSSQGLKRFQWFGLAVIFIYLSLDEALQLHDQLDLPLRAALGTSGIFRHAWIIPYALILLGLVLIYGRFLLELRKESRIRFIFSGIIFITGAIGFEILSGLRAESVGYANAGYAFIYTIEEFLEMLGIALCAYSLLKHIEHSIGNMRIEYK